ncbi:ABC transporter permease subunit [Paenibacillus sp. LMG 31460]|uniref:ABC transporter permease subunit n=1 Tax=Paenibacillus germinis TaxID=2654979 RepID=A0ABX1YX21_9BACL|nr:ABC transporter permease [Paenibacillus germinis]NOU84759.1 ABC transporter permease subunit [Paenibacillus germinis]
MKEVILSKDQQAAVSTLKSLEEPTRASTGKVRAGYTVIFTQPMKLFPYFFGLVFLLLWQFRGIHTLFSLERYQLPIPSDILTAMRENGDILLIYTLYTGVEIIGGFLIGSLLGWLAAVAASFRPQAGAGAISIMASLNAVPIVALAPIMNNWLGDGVASRMGIVSVMTMATMAVSTYKGLRSIEPSYLELMTSYAASTRQLFLKLRLPKALPAIFSALKINMSTSIIGAIVGEFFIASRGLGYLLSDQIRLANMPLAWACIVIAAILGIVLYTIIQLVEKRFIPWSISNR